MNREAVLHINTEDYIYPIARNQLIFQIRVAKEELVQCEIVYWNRDDGIKKTAQLNCSIRDDLFDYYRGEVKFKKVARYQKYYFHMIDKQGADWYYSTIGITKEEPQDNFFEYLYANGTDVVSYPDWSKGTIYYQIFPERFYDGNKENNPENCMEWGTPPTRENYMGGDLKGIQKKLPYLKKLGIECIYLNPIFHADFNHKYATSDYFKVDPIFGSNQDFKELVEECHKNGIKILLDGVFNHSGIHTSFFQDIIKNQGKSEYKDWYLLEKDEIEISEKDYECVGAYKWMPKFNSANPEVRSFILKVMDYWISQYHIDGWRLDVADEVDTTVWHMAYMVLKEKYPDIILLGETWGYGGRLVLGSQMDSVMNYMFRDAVWDYFGREKIEAREFDYRINHMLGMYKEETMKVLYNLLDSHDTERFLSICQENKALFKLAVAFQFLFIGSPAIYYGDEIGLTGNNDPDCRRCMIWDETIDQDLLQWYQSFITIRKEHESIRLGSFQSIISDTESDTYGFIRSTTEEEIYVIIHKGSRNEEILCPVLQSGEYEDLISKDKYQAEEKQCYMYNEDIAEYKGILRVCMAPYSVKVICKKKEVFL